MPEAVENSSGSSGGLPQSFLVLLFLGFLAPGVILVNVPVAGVLAAISDCWWFLEEILFQGSFSVNLLLEEGAEVRDIAVAISSEVFVVFLDKLPPFLEDSAVLVVSFLPGDAMEPATL